MDISSPSLMLQPISAATISWNPEDVFPSYLPRMTNPLNVDITLYMQQYSQDERLWSVEWKIVTPLAINSLNEDGQAEVVIPSLALNCRLPLHDNTQSVEVGLCPVIVRVSVSGNHGAELGSLYLILLAFGLVLSTWSPVFHNLTSVVFAISGETMK